MTSLHQKQQTTSLEVHVYSCNHILNVISCNHIFNIITLCASTEYDPWLLEINPIHFQFSEIRDKYALAQKEIAQLNTEVQDATYDLQKANHRVDNLVKRLNELEDMNKRLREGTTTPGEPGESGPTQVIKQSISVIDKEVYFESSYPNQSYYY